MKKSHLAVDIGASSGRVMASWLKKVSGNESKIRLEEVYRFKNKMQDTENHLTWDIGHLIGSIKNGIKEAVKREYHPISLGIDTWAVDFVLLDKEGNRLTDAIAYRDNRTNGIMEEVFKTIPKEIIYKRTGIQFQPFNTLYQLAALKEQSPDVLNRAEKFLMIPDYLNYLLTGKAVNEYTNATSTQFLNIEKNDWDRELLSELDIPSHFLQKIKLPGTTLGKLTESVSKEVGTQLKVILPVTHDTGSAVVAVPENKETLYLSSGTWSLFGFETEDPITTPEAMNYNFTNEGGINYRFRFLKNIMGLWMIQEVKRLMDDRFSFAEYVTLAREASDFKSTVDVNDNRFLNPENMIEEIETYCQETSQNVPSTPGELAQTIFSSLAKSYAKTAKEIEELTGKTYGQINIIGGGSQNNLLNELLAKESGKTVYTGPTEATAIGNAVIQLIEAGEINNLEEARKIIKKSFEIKKYTSKGE